MKNKKAYDSLVYSVLGTVLVVTVLLCANACDRELENAAPKAGEKKLNHATSIYEVEFDGAKYIVVDTHRGIGVCAKVEQTEASTPKCNIHVSGIPVNDPARPLDSVFPPQYLIPGAPYMDGPLNLQPPKIGPDGLPLDN